MLLGRFFWAFFREVVLSGAIFIGPIGCDFLKTLANLFGCPQAKPLQFYLESPGLRCASSGLGVCKNLFISVQRLLR